MISVYAIGSFVKVDGDIPATIRAITIYNASWIKYLCVWWDERHRKEEWLHESEFKVVNHETMLVEEGKL